MLCYIPPTKSSKNDTVFRKTTKKRQKNDKKMTKKWQNNDKKMTKTQVFNVLLHSSYKIIKEWYGFSKNGKKRQKNDKKMTKKWQENGKNSRVLMFCYIPPTKSSKNDTVFRKTTKKWQNNDKKMTK